MLDKEKEREEEWKRPNEKHCHVVVLMVSSAFGDEHGA